ncbi:MAG: polyprenyl synthetase family protein [Chloroflexi bacterium]|nr:polyprenyl synthetase family protein [Chloroflexota bacterium]MDL1941605.1 polyprenyl synthetase family protein [Chloroflexi bacterium CFX2]
MTIQQSMLEAIEEELKRQVARLDQPRVRPFHEMLTYHMGWTGEDAGPNATGKRIRPLLTLLVTASCFSDGVGLKNDNKGNWLHAVSAAAAIELIHNFSLAHDDIQDNSTLRRGRKTLWVKWGSPMAINVGDALFVIANQAILDLSKHYPADVVVRAATVLNDSCLDLTRGQYLDMSYEERADLTMDDYWPMIGGKTSSLLSACTQIGAILGYAQETQIEAFRLFGYHLGLAFQVQDDILGIWGDEGVTGKSAASDLVEGKNSLPVLFALEKNGEFAERWRRGPISLEEVSRAAAMLEAEGGKAFAEKISAEETQKALRCLQEANPQGEAGRVILQLANMLLKRNQ